MTEKKFPAPKNKEPHPCEGCVWRGWNIVGDAGCIKNSMLVTETCPDFSTK